MALLARTWEYGVVWSGLFHDKTVKKTETIGPGMGFLPALAGMIIPSMFSFLFLIIVKSEGYKSEEAWRKLVTKQTFL